MSIHDVFQALNESHVNEVQSGVVESSSNQLGDYSIEQYGDQYYLSIDFKGSFGDAVSSSTGIGSSLVSDMYYNLNAAKKAMKSVRRSLDGIFGKNPSNRIAAKKVYDSDYAQEELDDLFAEWSHSGR